MTTVAIVSALIVFICVYFIVTNKVDQQEQKSNESLEDYYMDMATPDVPVTKEYVDMMHSQESVHEYSDRVTIVQPFMIPEEKYHWMADCVCAIINKKEFSGHLGLDDDHVDADIRTMVLLEIEYRKSEGLIHE